jgi:hypothetical protein
VYPGDRRGCSEVEEVIVVVCVALLVMRVVKCALLCMLKIVIGLNRGWGRTWSWHTFWTVCRHTVMSMQMAEAWIVVY